VVVYHQKVVVSLSGILDGMVMIQYHKTPVEDRMVMVVLGVLMLR
jgi:hypothetical protein